METGPNDISEGNETKAEKSSKNDKPSDLVLLDSSVGSPPDQCTECAQIKDSEESEKHKEAFDTEKQANNNKKEEDRLLVADTQSEKTSPSAGMVGLVSVKNIAATKTVCSSIETDAELEITSCNDQLTQLVVLEEITPEDSVFVSNQVDETQITSTVASTTDQDVSSALINEDAVNEIVSDTQVCMDAVHECGVVPSNTISEDTKMHVIQKESNIENHGEICFENTEENSENLPVIPVMAEEFTVPFDVAIETVEIPSTSDALAFAFNMADKGIDVRCVKAYEELDSEVVNSETFDTSFNPGSQNDSSNTCSTVLRDKNKNSRKNKIANAKKSSHPPNGGVVSSLLTSNGLKSCSKTDENTNKDNERKSEKMSTVASAQNESVKSVERPDDEEDGFKGFLGGRPYTQNVDGVENLGTPCRTNNRADLHLYTNDEPCVSPVKKFDPKAHSTLKSIRTKDCKSTDSTIGEQNEIKSGKKRIKINTNHTELVIPSRAETQKTRRPQIYKNSLAIFEIDKADQKLLTRPTICLTRTSPDHMIDFYLQPLRNTTKRHKPSSINEGTAEKRRRLEPETPSVKEACRQFEQARPKSRIQEVVLKDKTVTYNKTTGTVNLQYSSTYESNNVAFNDFDPNFHSDYDDNCSIYSDHIQNPPIIHPFEELPVLHLTAPIKEIELPQAEPEFSNSPKFLPDSDRIVQNCLVENGEAVCNDNLKVNNRTQFLSNNSNFYNNPNKLNVLDVLCDSNSHNIHYSHNIQPSSFRIDDTDNHYVSCLQENVVPVPTAVPHIFNDIISNSFHDESSRDSGNGNFDQENGVGETRLPFKKRRMSVATVKSELVKEDISYPATPMISIAEVEALQNCKVEGKTRTFKTPAERKEMPPLPPVFYNLNSEPSPIITDQFNINNHTYNNPTINYHMGNVPVPFINIPCTPYYSVPPILVPFNNMQSFDNQRNRLQEKSIDPGLNKKKKRQESKR